MSFASNAVLFGCSVSVGTATIGVQGAAESSRVLFFSLSNGDSGISLVQAFARIADALCPLQEPSDDAGDVAVAQERAPNKRGTVPPTAMTELGPMLSILESLHAPMPRTECRRVGSSREWWLHPCCYSSVV